MTQTATSARRRVTISPLRYPGGKGLLYSRLRTIIRENDLTSSVYVEPYAGGAGAALALLVSGQVERIAINDLDPAVFAFWNAVVTQPDEFTTLLNGVELSVDEWERQREVYLTSARDDHLSLGFATFYLNRTNRSGVLNGGPIGGKDQTGNYKIDARFNREGLAERIRLIALHADRIAVTNEDGLRVIERYSDRDDAFIYADPPYFEKAGSLYLNAFQDSDHQALAGCLKGVRRAKWILTYDNVPQVAELYSDLRRRLFALNYSAHRVMKASEIMVFSSDLAIPEEIESAHAGLAQVADAATGGAR
ncbi:DNA adenine methylase [Actinomycetaceae bacterium Sa1BUA1]|uniref:DNA adenine methylase n=1 Tax=Oceanitalea stevensii TaxID=2763072 RepID=A0ABR8Z5Y3_9MICO|nr:DNA adenine methylase [Oceanitalea stevensii]